MDAHLPVWTLLAGIIDRPGRTLGEILDNPRWRWALPALIAIASIVVFTAVSVPIVREQTSQVIASQLSDQLSQLPADQAARVQSQMEFLQSPAFLVGAGIGSGILGLVIGWVLQAGILYLIGLLAGADVSFVNLIGTLPWLGLPGALREFIQAAYIMQKGQLVVNEGLSYLVSSGHGRDRCAEPRLRPVELRESIRPLAVGSGVRALPWWDEVQSQYRHLADRDLPRHTCCNKDGHWSHWRHVQLHGGLRLARLAGIDSPARPLSTTTTLAPSSSAR